MSGLKKSKKNIYLLGSKVEVNCEQFRRAAKIKGGRLFTQKKKKKKKKKKNNNNNNKK